MKDLSKKILPMFLYVTLGLSGFLYLMFAFGILSEGILLNWCYVLSVIAGVISVVFPIVGMAQNLQAAKYTLIGLGLLAIILLVSYTLSTGEAYKIGERIVEGAVSRWSEAGLYTFYIMITLTLLVIIYTEVNKALK